MNLKTSSLNVSFFFVHSAFFYPLSASPFFPIFFIHSSFSILFIPPSILPHLLLSHVPFIYRLSVVDPCHFSLSFVSSLSIFFFSFLRPCLLNKLLLIYLFYLLFFSPLLFLPLPLGLALLISLDFLLFFPSKTSLCLSSFTIPSFLLGNRLFFSLLQTYLLLFFLSLFSTFFLPPSYFVAPHH